MTETSAVRFEEVLEAELKEVHTSRKTRSVAGTEISKEGSAYEKAAHAQLIGLAFSGGGVRSATFNLGVLQALARFGVLGSIDYLSSVDGGSYIAGWFVAWLRRSGLKEVEAQLGEARPATSGHFEAPEVQQLRKSTRYAVSRTGIFGSPSAALTWLRNVSLNLVILSMVLGAFLLLGDVFLRGIEFLMFAALLRMPFAIAVLVVLAAVLFGILSMNSDDEGTRALFRLRVLWAAAVCIFGAAALGGTYIRMTLPGLHGLWWLWPAAGLTLLFVVGWIRGRSSPKVLFLHTVSAAVAGTVGGLLFRELALLLSLSWRDVTFATPLVIVAIALAGLIYMFLMDRWNSRQERDLAVRVGALLVSAALIWVLVALVWQSESEMRLLPSAALWGMVTLWGMVVVAGLLRGRTHLPAGPTRMLLDVCAYVAPYIFVIGFSALTVRPLIWTLRGFLPSFSHAQNIFLIEMLSAGVLLLLALLLTWRAGANEFSMQSYYRGRIVRSYLGPSVGTHRDDGTLYAGAEEDLALSDITGASGYVGPYPVVGAALDVFEGNASGLRRTDISPFVFAPTYSGFEPPGAVGKKSQGLSVGVGYRRTREFGGGISLGTAMAVSGSSRSDSARPPSAAAAFLWGAFDLRSGWWLGNPCREDTWRKPGPRSGLAYSLIERPGTSREPGYVHLSGGSLFDNLGVYELVKRHCGLIIACDASADAALTFEDLGDVIKKCRTDLGVEIEIDIGGLRGKETAFKRSHCAVGRIRYGTGDSGVLIYVKPSLTGDEPADLLQYVGVHLAFPFASTSPEFDDSEFESYRSLGQHIMESLLASFRDQVTMASTAADGFAAAIRRPPGHGDQESAFSRLATKPPSDPPKELVDAIASQECVLCAGPGLAAQAGLPTWGAFLEGLLRFGRAKEAIDADSATGLAASLAGKAFEPVADELAHKVPRNLIVEYVTSTLSGARPSQAHQLLAELPFMGVLNTNFDAVLADAFADRNSRPLVETDAEEVVAALRAKTFFLLNVVGAFLQPSSLLFTAKELRTLLSTNLHLKQSLVTMFLRYNVFFVGTSVRGINDYLEVLELPQRPDRRHFALVAYSDEFDPVELRYLDRSYNIEVIGYRPRENYPELVPFLKLLLSAVRQRSPSSKSSGPPVLQHVCLTNIGPFDRLDLDLEPSWNVLLGDNGVGKTVVLRAIAAALCGEAADQTTVTRLLRSGADSGSIRLKVEGRDYTVDLKRDPDGNVRIVSASLSPLKYDNWLVLGFPALRSIPWDRPKGPSNPKPGAPSADDLLPILRGEPDARIADIKQWLVNLDYASGSEPQPSRSGKLLEEFFEVLQRLTPDLRLSLHSIDRKTMEITIQTDGGLVPLEAISQGTGSVMCWIGTLLERLSEAGNPEEPKQSVGLVLIDEIDAHMHPKWQQLFVEAFRGQFKTVQVIATTHSPLIVGSLTPREIWLVHRAPLKSEIYGVVQLRKADDGTQEIGIFGPEDDLEDGQVGEKREERKYRVPASVELLVKNGDVVEERGPLTKTMMVVAERVAAGQEGWRADQILTGPLFNLETTRDPKTRDLMSAYTRLTTLESPTEDQKKELAEVAAELHVRTASPQEKEAARMAYSLIHEFANERLKSLPPERRQEVLDEVKVQLTEAITGSRRPE